MSRPLLAVEQNGIIEFAVVISIEFAPTMGSNFATLASPRYGGKSYG